MNKNRLIVSWLVCAALVSVVACPAVAGEITRPLPEKEVKVFLAQLNSQGIVAAFDKNMKKDTYLGLAEGSAYFSLEPGGNIGYCLYRADINNDGKDEYILCTSQGSGAFFDIESIYQDNGKFVDIYNEIKIPLRKLVREAEKEKYNLEEGYSGFINGSIRIEKENGKMSFTLEQVTRKYENKGSFEEDFNPSQSYKFLWEKSGIKLVKYSVGAKIYKP